MASEKRQRGALPAWLRQVTRAERYPHRDRYLEQVRQAAQRLIDEGYLLAEDLELVVGQASRRYELLAAMREPVAAGE